MDTRCELSAPLIIMAAPPNNSQARGTASVDDLSTLSQISANIKAVEELSTVLDIAEVGLK